MKRLLNCTGKEMLSYNGKELKQAIKASEGRTIVSETVISIRPLLDDISNPELAASFGSDLILLNTFDVLNPHIEGIDSPSPVETLKKLIARPVGCNLEPVDENIAMMEERLAIPEGRQASEKTFKRANELGLQFICLTGNPGTGVSNASICLAIKKAKEHFDGLIIAGKMHSAGVDEELVDLEAIASFIEAGADIILLPAVNTVPGLDEKSVSEACKFIHNHNALALTAIGTSQEGADEHTIREIALANKRCGADLQHIGDAGWCGIALPENIMSLSIAIRGKRWTYHRMASSINRD
ncbi:MAG TPA: PEP phosphonomutase [Kandleria vitulina]|nr:PEP phosphonomutase [Kandleria vitulina]